MSIRDELLAEFDHEIGSTRRLVERIRDERLSWTPHARSRSAAALAAHLADIPRWGEVLLTRPGFELTEAPPPTVPGESVAALLEAFDGAARRTRQLMDLSDADYRTPWTLTREGYQVFSIPRVAAFRSFVLHHLIHHRGQLTVYLRLMDIAVPAVYGPTADDGWAAR